MGEFYGLIFTPLFLSPLLSFFFSYPSNIEIIFDFSDIITKMHPPFQNPGSALEEVAEEEEEKQIDYEELLSDDEQI